MKILIADDDPVFRQLLAATLRKLGHEPAIAESGREAWEVFQKESCSLIITDWIMAGIDGLELCRLVRAERRTRYTYIILLTVMEGKGAYLEGMNAGVDDFVTKPFDADQLAARLRVAERILGLQTQIKQLEGLLPICMYCRRIRDDGNDWSGIEEYISRRTDASFSHGVCPQCFTTVVEPELARMKKGSQEG